jgi:four helix bundle protein
VSLNANLAEGEARETARDRLRVFTIAWGELRELSAHVELAAAVNALSRSDAARLASHCRHVGRMLHALRRAVAERARRKPPDH